ncbi:WD40 repeat domain-containing protein [Streptomyces sp. VRA16 Mangrove soil]|uniref:WD40 repeat domain-containing protein n=1 Tax=Streptomyces sp. VRA16 Mangrove soil TaxID=2817434 RepID=UPI001A9D3CC3|nr:WD40 repeat domain-containing protein [Streptomyces sp. VRA16 Mangrove soil]MBO1335288.1 WD40 repeat domain-containing protein [Streptomyces sp. VRA16 Mangrove soil]
MNVDELLKEALREQADSVEPAPADFADRVLATRRRRHGRTVTLAAVAVTAVIAGAVVVPQIGGGEDVRPAGVTGTQDVIAHPDQSPPKDVIAAGRTALASFVTYKTVVYKNGDGIRERIYGVIDPTTKTYRKTTRWSWLSVAPGLRTAAVLEKDVPAKRIGLLDLATNKVKRWIPVARGAAGLAFSPDGSKLVATTYAKDPDRLYKRNRVDDGSGKIMPGPDFQSTRTGFAVVDLRTGHSDWHEVTENEDTNARQDFEFNADGTLVHAGVMTGGVPEQYFDLKGRKAAVPAGERHVEWYIEAGLSPNGKLVAGDFAGKGDEIAVAVNDARTGKVVEKLPAQQLVAWADDKRVVAWGCDPKRCDGTGEFHNQLLLITLGTHKVVPLSDFRKASADYPGRWSPQFTRR